MKNYFRTCLMLLCIVVLASCGNKGGRMLTSATGTIYECLVVMNNNPLSDESREALFTSPNRPKETGSAYQEPIATTYDIVRATLAADMPALPQMEPYFVLSQVTPSQFDNYLKPTRNILIVDINPQQYTQVKAVRAVNQWSKPQAVYRIQAPSDDEFVKYWLEHGDEVRDWFVRRELARQATFYRANTNKDARACLQAQGYDMLIPEDYMLIMDTALVLTDRNVQVVWCCNNKGPMRRDIVVYAYPYIAQAQFSNDSICAMRDEVLGRLVSAQVPGSHMGTEYRYAQPITRSVQPLNGEDVGFYGVETRGLWRIVDGEAMGGAFVCLTRLDPVNARVVAAETFLFANGQKKRNALRQAEAILYTLQMPQER